MSETHDEDDLPPKKEPPHDSTFSMVFGEVAGSMVWIVIILALAGAVAWLVLRSMGQH